MSKLVTVMKESPKSDAAEAPAKKDTILTVTTYVVTHLPFLLFLLNPVIVIPVPTNDINLVKEIRRVSFLLLLEFDRFHPILVLI